MLVSFSGHAQLGDLAKKLKNKVEKKEVEKKKPLANSVFTFAQQINVSQA